VNKAIFFDRDGVLVKPVWRDIKNDYTPPWSRSEFEVFPGVGEALEKSANAGFKNLVITNQPDVLDGFIAADDCVYFSFYLMTTFPIDDIFESYRRGEWSYKPNPGHIDVAKEKHKLNLAHCYFIGDTWKDSVCAALRCLPYVHIGQHTPIGSVAYHADDVSDAVNWILRDEDRQLWEVIGK
jgi:histidinol phosphatase-like enzyme